MEGRGSPSARPPERLTFNYGRGSVPSRAVVEAALAADAAPTFATAPIAEPRDWGYGGLLLFTAVLLLRPQDWIPALKPFHLAEVCALAGLAPMVLHRFARRMPVFRVTPETTGLMVFGLAILATVPFAIWPGGAFGTFTDMYLKALVVFVLMMNTLTTPERLERMTWVILVCIGIIAARGVADYVRGVNLIEGGRLAGPVGGIFGNPNDLALNMVTFMPLAIVMAISRRYSPVRRVAAAAIAALMLATIVFTKSRGGVLGLLVMLGTLVILARQIRPGFAVAIVVAVLAAMPFMPSSFWTRMNSIFNEEQDRTEFTGSRETRRIDMEEGIRTFLEHPLTGVGAGDFQAYNPPWREERWRETHNALIQVAAETGIVGLCAFSFLIVRTFGATLRARRLLKRPKRRRPDVLSSVMSHSEREALLAQTIAMTAGFAGWFVCAMFASVAYNWTLYYLIALIVSTRELVLVRVAAGLAAWRGAENVPAVRTAKVFRGTAARFA